MLFWIGIQNILWKNTYPLLILRLYAVVKYILNLLSALCYKSLFVKKFWSETASGQALDLGYLAKISFYSSILKIECVFL